MDPASVEELNRRVQEGFIPIVSELAGFLAYYVVSAGEGEIISISIFEEKGGSDKSTGSASDWIEANIASLLPTAPEITTGEVIMHVHKLG
jgi:hypothetical protein